jgi:predicted ABC-type ATPase
MPARIVVLAGVNGAGKSSVAGEAIRESGGEFYDPDAAARRLRARTPGTTPEQANAEAWEVGRRGLELALERGEFFAFETTLGGRTILSMLLAGAAGGAEIHLSYIGLASPELHVERVARWVAAGGHAIPREKIIEHWTASRRNLVRLVPHLTSLRLYDNSADADPGRGGRPAPKLLLHLERGVLRERVPLAAVLDWAKPLVAAAIAGAGPRPPNLG